MVLYHVSLNVNDTRIKEFIPRIPWATADSEDIETPRICMSPSIVGCCTGIGYDSAFKAGVPVMVYEANAPEKYIKYPEEILEKYGVYDALCTQEHWVTCPITAYGNKYRIMSFERDNYLLPEPRVNKDVRNYLSSKYADYKDSMSLHFLLNVFIGRHGIDEEDFAKMFDIKGIRVFTKIGLEVLNETGN